MTLVEKELPERFEYLSNVLRWVNTVPLFDPVPIMLGFHDEVIKHSQRLSSLVACMSCLLFFVAYKLLIRPSSKHGYK